MVMASRQLNLRFDERHHDVVRRVVDRLRSDSGFLASLEELLASDSTPAGGHEAAEALGRIARLERRLDALEPRVDDLETVRAAPCPRPHRKPPSVPSAAADSAGVPAGGVGGAPAGRRNSRAIPEEHLAEADRLNREGISFQKIIEMKGWPYNRSGLDKAVNRWRKSRS
jgi:hypothetical protein